MELRTHLDAGTELGDALRLMHGERKLGLMYLWPAVMAVCEVEKKEAMRITVHETAEWRRDGSADP
jgi:hypothetical protein